MISSGKNLLKNFKQPGKYQLLKKLHKKYQPLGEKLSAHEKVSIPKKAPRTLKVFTTLKSLNPPPPEI